MNALCGIMQMNILQVLEDVGNLNTTGENNALSL